MEIRKVLHRRDVGGIQAIDNSRLPTPAKRFSKEPSTWTFASQGSQVLTQHGNSEQAYACPHSSRLKQWVARFWLSSSTTKHYGICCMMCVNLSEGTARVQSLSKRTIRALTQNFWFQQEPVRKAAVVAELNLVSLVCLFFCSFFLL